MTDQIGLSAADRQLLRQVFAWARANGWKRVYPDYDGPHLKDLRDWHWFGPDREVFLEVLASRKTTPDWRFVASSTFAEGVEIGADGSLNVRRCVDVLCALGILPAHFSSAFEAGRESASTQAETEWSARMKDGRPAFACTFTEGGARRYADEQPDRLAVFTRRVGPWKRVD